jgi:Leucine-rich repeat (LRR) protein
LESVVNSIKSKGSLSSTKLQSSKEVILSYTDRNIEILPSDIGKHFVNLNTFVAKSMGLRSVKRNNFENMKNLTVLNLGENKITKIEWNSFSELTYLEVLFLHGNKIQILSPFALNKLLALKSFNAEYNLIAKIDENFDHNSQIEGIYLRGNKISKVKQDFTKLKHLKVVDLSRNEEVCEKRKIYNQNELNKFHQSCNTLSAQEKIRYQKAYQKCVSTELNKNEKLKNDFENCTLLLINDEIRNNKTYENCTLKAKFLVKNYNNCLVALIQESEKTRTNFEDCVAMKINEDIEAEGFLRNCTFERDSKKFNVDQRLSECNVMPKLVDTKLIEKCELKYNVIRGKPIVEFQKNVKQYFGSM